MSPLLAFRLTEAMQDVDQTRGVAESLATTGFEASKVLP